MAYLLKDRHRGPVPSSRLALHAFPVKDVNSIIVPTVTGGCAADPTCDVYNIFPAGPAAQVVRGACSNLIAAAANRVFTPWGSVTWTAEAGATIAANADQPSSNNAYASMKVTQGAAGAGYAQLAVAGLTAAQPYYFSILAKAYAAGDVGKTLRVYNDGTTADLALTAGWKVIGVADASASGTTVNYRAYIQGGAEGDSFLMSMAQITNTAYPLWFVNGSGTAMSQTVPTASLPLYAGGPFTIMCYLLPCYPGNDGVEHIFFDNMGTGASQNRIAIWKATNNYLYGLVYDNSSGNKNCQKDVSAVWLAGTPIAIMFSRDTLGVMNAYFNRVAMTLNIGAGTGLESVLGANCGLGCSALGTSPSNTPGYYSFLNRAITPTEWLAICDELGVA